jgi:hypothetical protein
MSKFLLALVAILSIGAGVANAAQPQTHSKAPQQQGDQFNFLEGGGG